MCLNQCESSVWVKCFSFIRPCGINERVGYEGIFKLMVYEILVRCMQTQTCVQGAADLRPIFPLKVVYERAVNTADGISLISLLFPLCSTRQTSLSLSLSLSSSSLVSLLFPTALWGFSSVMVFHRCLLCLDYSVLSVRRFVNLFFNAVMKNYV